MLRFLTFIFIFSKQTKHLPSGRQKYKNLRKSINKNITNFNSLFCFLYQKRNTFLWARRELVYSNQPTNQPQLRFFRRWQTFCIPICFCLYVHQKIHWWLKTIARSKIIKQIIKNKKLQVLFLIILLKVARCSSRK